MPQHRLVVTPRSGTRRAPNKRHRIYGSEYLVLASPTPSRKRAFLVSNISDFHKSQDLESRKGRPSAPRESEVSRKDPSVRSHNPTLFGVPRFAGDAM
jgi:hypothetical protein